MIRETWSTSTNCVSVTGRCWRSTSRACAPGCSTLERWCSLRARRPGARSGRSSPTCRGRARRSRYGLRHPRPRPCCRSYSRPHNRPHRWRRRRHRPPGRVVTAPLAESIARPGAKLDDGIPIIPFKRLDDDEAPLPATVPSGDLREVAAAALEADAPSAGPWQWPGGGPRTDAGVTDAAVPRGHAVAPRAARPDMPTTPAKTTGPTRIVPTEGEVLVRQGPVDPRAIVYPPVPGEQAVRAAVEWGKDVVTKGREQIAHLPTPPIPSCRGSRRRSRHQLARTRLRRAASSPRSPSPPPSCSG